MLWKVHLECKSYLLCHKSLPFRVFLGLPRSESKCCGLIDAEAFSTSICEGRIYAGSVTADLTDPFIKSRAIFWSSSREELKISQDDRGSGKQNRCFVTGGLTGSESNELFILIYAESNSRGFLEQILNMKHLGMCVFVWIKLNINYVLLWRTARQGTTYWKPVTPKVIKFGYSQTFTWISFFLVIINIKYVKA